MVVADNIIRRLVPATKKPATPRIDWSNPLARGLTRVYAFTQQGQFVYDPVSGSVIAGTSTSGTRFYGNATVAGYQGRLTAVFDGADDTIECGTTTGVHGGDLSIFANIYLASTGATASIASADASDQSKREWQFRIESSGAVGFIPFVSNSNGSVTSSNTLSAGRWYGVGCRHSSTISTNNISVFVDGQNKGSATKAGALDNDASGLTIGARGRQYPITYAGDVAEDFSGGIELVYIWNRALSDEEHAQIAANPYQIFAVPQYTLTTEAAGGGTDHIIRRLVPARRQPRPPFRLNPEFADGCLSAIPVLTGEACDIVGGYRATGLDSPSRYSFVDTPFGRGVQGDGVSLSAVRGLVLTGGRPLGEADEYSSLTLFSLNSLSSAVENDLYRCTNTDVGQGVGLVIYPSLNKIRSVLATTGSTGWTASHDFTYSDGFQTNVLYALAVSYRSGDRRIAICPVGKNTVRTLDTTAITGGITYSLAGKPLYIGGLQNGSEPAAAFDGVIYSNVFWNKRLDNDVLRRLVTDPYQIFSVPQYTLTTEAGGGGPTYVDVAGTSASAVTTTGSLTAFLGLGGTSSATVTSSGTLTAFIGLDGSISGTVTTTGDLTIGSVTYVDVAGISAATVTTTGAMSPFRGLSGTSTGSVTSTGGLSLIHGLVGTASSTATPTGVLSQTLAFSGSVSAISASAGAITVGATEMVGLISATSTMTGTMRFIFEDVTGVTDTWTNSPPDSSTWTDS